jgi:adenosine deaminase/adenosine deaminase CECR1
MVRAFLQRMPKGGDLHVHLSGAVYAESLIAWGIEAKMCLDTATLTITSPPCDAPAGRPPLAEAIQERGRYGVLVDGLSTRNLPQGSTAGHDRFFHAFARFGAVAAERSVDMIAELATGAADQHVSYLELMVTFRAREARQLGARVGFDGDFAATRRRLLDAGLGAIVADGASDVTRLEQAVIDRLGCPAAPGAAPPPACRIVRRYLQQSSRTADPSVVFAQLVYAFELARADRRVVGINLVAPEDDPVARRDYRLHMRMVGWLVETYPGVNVALHAGELTLGLVPPADLAFHIREAVEIGRAKRIGHGVSIAYERDALQLMDLMRARDVLVEICLTSNEVILGVAGPWHPFADYWHRGVPLALASDDPGVARGDLTAEYARAATEHGLGYVDLKRLARNSVRHSFLAGAELWQDRETLVPAAPCAGLRPGTTATAECQGFLDGSDKARAQWALEAAFIEFESLPWFR